MLSRNKGITLILSLLSLASITFIARLSSRRGLSPPGWLPTLHVRPLNACRDKVDWLADLNLTYPIRYAHRDIVVNPILGLERASITKLDGSLFPQFQTIDISENTSFSPQHCAEPYVRILGVHVSSSEPSFESKDMSWERSLSRHGFKARYTPSDR